MCAVHQVVATNASARLTSTPADSRPNATSTRVEQAVQAAVGLDVAPPRPRQRPGRVDGDDPHPQPARREPARQVELRDVAAEQVAQVDRRDEQVHAPRRAVGDRQAQRRDLLRHGTQLLLAGSARLRRRIDQRRRDRVEPQEALRPIAGVRRDQVPPRERVREHPLAAERLPALPGDLARAAQPQARHRDDRPLARRELLQRAPLVGAHPVPAALLQDGRELEQPAGVAEVVHAPQPRALARAPPQGPDAIEQARHPVRLGVTDERLAVLDVVVERPVDIADVAERERAEREPVVVEVRELGRREGQRDVEQVAPEQRRRAGDRIGDEQRAQVGVVVAPVAPVRRGEEPAVRADDPRVAVDQSRVSDLRQQRRELVRVPHVVLVGQRDDAGGGRRQPERALEVPVEAEPAGRAREHEARVAAERVLHHRDALGGRAVVRHDAQPVPVRLRADRLDLAREQRLRRLVRRHADRHLGRGVGDGRERRREREARERGGLLPAPGEERPQPERVLRLRDRDPREAPEPAAIARRRRAAPAARRSAACRPPSTAGRRRRPRARARRSGHRAPSTARRRTRPCPPRSRAPRGAARRAGPGGRPSKRA